MEAFLKLRQLRAELMRGRNMIESLRRREKLKRQLLDIADDTFDQAIYDMVDTSGNKRTPWTLKNVKQRDTHTVFWARDYCCCCCCCWFLMALVDNPCAPVTARTPAPEAAKGRGGAQEAASSKGECGIQPWPFTPTHTQRAFLCSQPRAALAILALCVPQQAARRQQRRQAEMMAAQGGVIGGRLRVPTLPPPVRAVEVDRAYADGA